MKPDLWTALEAKNRGRILRTRRIICLTCVQPHIPKSMGKLKDGHRIFDLTRQMKGKPCSCHISLTRTLTVSYCLRGPSINDINPNFHFLPFLCYPIYYPNTQGYLTQDLFHSTSLATWGSSGASKEVKFFKELTFLGFVRYFSAKIEQSSKMSKTELKNAHLGWFFKVCSILAEK